MEVGDSIPDHKLCGFLYTVLSIPPDQSLASNTPCYIFGEGADDVGFLSENDVVLSPIDRKPSSALALPLPDVATAARGGADSTPTRKAKSRRRSGGAGRRREKTASSGSWKKRKKWSGIGMVKGSLSVVRQLHVLVMHRCVKIRARVVGVAVKDCGGEARAVVLVDLYLPIALWSGWQFPRSGSTAAALLRHVSCDWGTRRLMIEFAKCDPKDDYSIWNVSDCHVFGCKQNCSAPDVVRKKLFELHEIFKSIPSVVKKENFVSTRISPADDFCKSGIWEVTDDILVNILSALSPVDLVKVSATCRHLRFLAAPIMPCIKLKLFPHQQAAVEWMLQREQEPEVLQHPLYIDCLTEDGFSFYVNIVSGEIITGAAPTVRDFRGGMFCDEPGLGKTVTALSLILKTLGTLADPPEGVQVTWCMHNGDRRCGYYEVTGDNVNNGRASLCKRIPGQGTRRGQLFLDKGTPEKDLTCSFPVGSNLMAPAMGFEASTGSSSAISASVACSVRYPQNLTQIKRNLVHSYEEFSGYSDDRRVRGTSRKRKVTLNSSKQSFVEQNGLSQGFPFNSKRPKNGTTDHHFDCNETWIQCDACRKWRKVADVGVAETSTAWFCSMNSDPLYQSCGVPEETWDYQHNITNFPGFHIKGTPGGSEENVAFFTSVLREHYELIDFETKKVLTWLAKLSPEKVSEMETIGLKHSVPDIGVVCGGEVHKYHKIFQAFGLIKKIDKGRTRWYYPQKLVNLVFDLAALRIALCEPLDSFRLYLSKATLIVVPANLVDHWKTQIQKHVIKDQLRVCVWTDHKKPSAHNLAWDYDVVITTFSRLSAEWSPRKRSVLMQVHWLRVILDEGHTLGSSLNLTNKLQMAISLHASNRWLLTGTPTPNTPNSQLSNFQPLLKFLHEEAYGHNQKSWDAGILWPFEAEMEEGRSRLIQLLHRCMISARKEDMVTIPPCIKKVTFLNFTEEHARSYNELVVTVRRNILMADWNDDSHVESLLNRKQWKFRSNTIRNVRLSCCVAGHIKVTDAGQDIQETMDILVEKGLEHNSEEYALIKYYLLHGGSCMMCNEWCRLPVVTPCRHLLCLDCVALDSERCTFPGCGYLYEMQSPEILTRPENPKPKWPVPKDLIELQPSYKQDDWHPEWQSTSSSKVAYLVHRLKEIQEAYEKIFGSGKEDNDAETSNELLFFQRSNYRKPFNWKDYARSFEESQKMLPEKVIIFSQFLEHIHVLEQQLTFAGIRFARMYSPMHSSDKVKSLYTFQNDATCMALVMDGSAALGLDLSFVTHVFLMEPIWDRSVEEQVISRAHRMGATRPIHVETLAMRGTIEEQMLKFLQDADDCRRLLKEEFGKTDRDGPRAHRTLHDFAESNYLAHLSCVRTCHKS